MSVGEPADALQRYARSGVWALPVWAALLGLVAAGAAGALTSELACPVRVPMHVMLWHVLPIAVYAAVGTAAVWLVIRLRRA